LRIRRFARLIWKENTTLGTEYVLNTAALFGLAFPQIPEVLIVNCRPIEAGDTTLAIESTIRAD